MWFYPYDPPAHACVATAYHPRGTGMVKAYTCISYHQHAACLQRVWVSHLLSNRSLVLNICADCSITVQATSLVILLKGSHTSYRSSSGISAGACVTRVQDLLHHQQVSYTTHRLNRHPKQPVELRGKQHKQGDEWYRCFTLDFRLPACMVAPVDHGHRFLGKSRKLTAGSCFWRPQIFQPSGAQVSRTSSWFYIAGLPKICPGMFNGGSSFADVTKVIPNIVNLVYDDRRIQSKSKIPSMGVTRPSVARATYNAKTAAPNPRHRISTDFRGGHLEFPPPLLQIPYTKSPWPAFDEYRSRCNSPLLLTSSGNTHRRILCFLVPQDWSKSFPETS